METVIGKSHNSFLSRAAVGQNVLVIVPHEDDEINVAGSIMYDYVQKGATVTCVFTTNGDYSFAAATRMAEAEHSLHTLGVQQIFFLGYGDTSNHYKGGHLFYAKQEPVTSPSGHKETYGAWHFEDYALQARGRHSPYCRAAMCEDLESLLLELAAPLIFCVDLDVHADHRAASLIFEEALGNILRRPGNTYQPIIVFKGFAYCTSFGAPKDFYARNIRSVPLPAQTEDSLIGFSLYTWQTRVRFPVLPACRGHFLRDNLLYRALFAHASQSAALHAVRIANGDAVFWQRRTDNLVYQAEITSSSGDPQHIADFAVVNLTDIDAKKLSFAQYLWLPVAGDRQRELCFSWPDEQEIAWLELGGNVESSGRIQELTLSFPDGTVYVLGPLPEKGHLLRFKLPAVKRTSSVCLRLDDVMGTGYGLSFVGFFSQEHQMGVVPSYIKLLVGDDFAYDYLLPTAASECQLSVYRYGASGSIRLQVKDASEGWVDQNGLAHFAPQAETLHVRAELEQQPSCYDEICLHRLSGLLLQKLSCQQYLEDKLLTFFLKKHRKYTHIRHKYLKKL